MELHARGSHGFGVSISGSSSQVYLTVRGHHASNMYMVRGQVGDEEIKAGFGRLGRVAMRFREGRKARVVPGSDGNCKGGGEIIERGSFIGTLNFRGEQGYSTVHTARATGRVVRIGRLVCGTEKGGGGEGSSGLHWLWLDARSKNGTVSFSANKITSQVHPKLDGAFFDASIFELRPRGMSVVRTLDTQADPAAFTAEKSDGHIAAASVAPPAPFRGTAAYQPTEGATSWTGTLTGVFPGRGEVRLAGPEFCVDFLSQPRKCGLGTSQLTLVG